MQKLEASSSSKNYMSMDCAYLTIECSPCQHLLGTVSALNYKDGIVSLNFICQGVFTTHAVDNIDHDPSSRSAKDSFHGAAISSTQHLNLIL